MTRARVVVLVFGVLAAGLAVAGFLAAFKRVDEDVEVGYRGVAAVNPFYAAELLLDEIGVPAESRYGLGALPPTDHVVIVLAPTIEARRPLADRLYEWVETGGHLVVAAPSTPSRASLLELLRAEEDDGASDRDCTPDDPLLEAAGLFLDLPAPKDRRGQSSGSDDAEASPRRLTSGRCGEAPRETVVVGGIELSRDHEAKLDGARVLAIHEEVEDENGFTWEQRTPVGHVARVPVGQGMVTALVDSWFLSNDAIGELDHASLLAELVSSDGRPAGALFVLRGEPSARPRRRLSLGLRQNRPI